MPQMVTYSVNVKVDKGPEIKSDAKLEAASYSASLEETICRGQVGYIDVDVQDATKLDMLVIASNTYMNDKETCMPAGQPVCRKYLWYKFEDPSACPNLNPAQGAAANAQDKACDTTTGWTKLGRPEVLASIALGRIPQKIQRISFKNELATDVKVSVLVVRPRETPST